MGELPLFLTENKINHFSERVFRFDEFRCPDYASPDRGTAPTVYNGQHDSAPCTRG